MQRRHSGGLVLIFMGTLVPGTALCQAYPAKPVRIVTSGAGGGNDFMSRLIAQGIAGPLGQPVIVENRPNTIVITETVLQAPADGYTIMLGSSSLWVLPLIQKTSYDVARDLTPVAMVDRAPNLLVVHPSLPVSSVKELIALARARPGELNFSYGTLASSAQLAAELLKSMAGIRLVGVSYKGSSLQLNAVLSGEVQLTFASATSSVAQFLKSGRLKALAVTSPEPTALLPGMPTVAAAGLPGYEVTSIDGLFARNGTPTAVITRLNQEVVRLVNQPEIREKIQSLGAEAVTGSPEQFAAVLKADIARVGKVVKEAGIRVDQ